MSALWAKGRVFWKERVGWDEERSMWALLIVLSAFFGVYVWKDCPPVGCL